MRYILSLSNLKLSYYRQFGSYNRKVWQGGKKMFASSSSSSSQVKENQGKGKEEFSIETRRHSGAHLMAYSIQKLYPGALFGVGPEIKDGWYYDIRFPKAISQQDFKAIEKEMLKLKAQKLPFERIELPIDEAISYMEAQGQTYKVELLIDLKSKGTTAIKDLEDGSMLTGNEVTVVSFYKIGEFVDLCRGPHVEHSGQVAQFELHSLSSAYWRGNSNNDSLTRVYAFSYMTKEEIFKRKQQIEAAKKNDHRTLGAKHHLFFIEPEEIGPGLALWEPKGMIIVNELMHLARQFEKRYGYEEVRTPELAYRGLFEKSGHIAHYLADMFPPMQLKGEKEVFLKPMSCPFHHAIYNAHGVPSYHTLPKRFKEWGKVHRYESAGTLTGLNRVRGITQDDSHIYLRPDQVVNELLQVIKLSEEYYKLFGFNNYRIVFALPDWEKKPDKYIKDDEGWTNAIKYMRQAIEEAGVRYLDAKGEAAFYGPKFDFIIEDEVTGKEFTISTVQLDFGATEKFDLRYLGSDGKKYPIYVIHRAPLGSIERMVATLIKHYAAKFPVWLAPEQVRILTLSDLDQKSKMYTENLKLWLEQQSINNGTSCFRVGIDFSSDTINKKIRTAQLDQIPYMVVIGEKEVSNNNISVRLRSGIQFSIEPEKFLERLKYEAEERVDLIGENPLVPKRETTKFPIILSSHRVVEETEVATNATTANFSPMLTFSCLTGTTAQQKAQSQQGQAIAESQGIDPTDKVLAEKKEEKTVEKTRLVNTL
jgi:threonyl-tRNA synthetase